MTPLPACPDRYRPLRLLGEGATGAVYEANDRLLGHKVALKVVRANLAIHARFRARFAHEVALSARVVHGRVVPVYDYGRLDDGRPFVSIAVADRGSLDDLLDKQPPLSEALRIIDQILDALGFLHAKGFLHQDLKPANVLLHSGPAGRTDAWISDLGVTEALSVLAMDRRGIAGTPGWMAPEQLMGRAVELGPWTDLYAVGLMLYAMLGGNIRSEGGEEARTSLLRARLQLKIKLKPDIPRALGEVVSNLLDPEPRQRYDRAADVRRALQHAVAALPVEVGAQGVSRTRMRQSTTTFAETFLPDGTSPIVAPRFEGDPPSAFRWNRVQPDPMPLRAPPESAGTASGRASLTLIALRDPPLVGRNEQRQRLWTLAREVTRTSAPQVALIVGDSGTGKSRLAASVAEALDQNGSMEPVTLRYHLPPGADDGYRGGVKELLAPWNDTRAELEERLTRWLARDWQAPRESVGEEAAILARWCGMLRDDETPIHLAAGLAYLYRWMDVHAWRGGTCLTLEDAHLAQASGDGLAICEALLRRTVGERPVLALATLSAAALASNPALQAQVDTLIGLGAIRIDVPRLADEEILHFFVDAYLLDPAHAGALAPLCQGSPAFATLLLRDLAARRHLVQRNDGRFELDTRVSLAKIVPQDLESLCLSRVEGALLTTEDPTAAAEALAVIALAGQDPPTLVVRTVSPGGLDALLATGLVRQRGWVLCFEHAEIGRAAAQIARRSRNQADLHRRLAEAWAALGRRTGADVDLHHGLHRLHGDQPEQAREPLGRAARTALAEGRPALALDAARFAALAADRIGALQDRLEARVQQAEALLELGRGEEAIQVASNARKLGKLSDRQNARLQVLLARAALSQGALEQADRLLDLAEEAYKDAKDAPGLAPVLLTRGALYRVFGYPAHASDCFRRVLDLEPEDARVEVQALREIIECRIAASDTVGIDQDVQLLYRAAMRSGDTALLSHATYAGGRIHLLAGRLDEAERHFRTAQALGATLGADGLVFLCQAHLGEVFRNRQMDVAAAEYFSAAARFAEERGWLDEAATTRLSLAMVLLRGGEEVRAHHEVDRASQHLAEQPHHWAWTLVGLLRALAAARLRDARACRAWWQVARDRGLERVRASPDLWLALQHLATAAGAMGLDDIASEALGLAHVPSEATAVLLHEPEDEDDDIIELPQAAIGGRRPATGPAPSPGERMSANDAPKTRAPSTTTFLPEDEPTPVPRPRSASSTFLPDDEPTPHSSPSPVSPSPVSPTRRAPPVPAAPVPTGRAAPTFIPEDDVPRASQTFMPEDETDPGDEAPRRRRK